VTTTIVGGGLHLGSTVTLVCPGAQVIVATDAIVNSNGRTVTATFNLSGVVPGQCAAAVTEPDGAVATTPFVVQQGGAATLWVDVIGFQSLRAGRAQTYYVLVGNSGNVDAVSVPLIVKYSKFLHADLGFEISPPPQLSKLPPIDWTQLPHEVDPLALTAIPTIVQSIPAGTTRILPLSIVAADVPANVHRPFQLIAGIGFPQTPDGALWELIYPHLVSQMALGSTGDPLDPNCAKALSDFSQALGRALDDLSKHQKTKDAITSIIDVLVAGRQVVADCLGGNPNDLEGWLNEALQVLDAAMQPGAELMALADLSQVVLDASTITSGDPNDKIGAQGVGTERYISGSGPLRYAIGFTNDSTATAAAATVVITDQLNNSYEDLSTFALGPITIGGQVVVPPQGATNFATTIDLRPSLNLWLQITAFMDSSSGLVTWRFVSLDPSTNLPPLDPSAGFLPPGEEGSVFITAMPQQNLTTGTQIANAATIVFDANPPMTTQLWTNTFDRSGPTSHVSALSSTENSTSFSVQWTGSDIGAGIESFSVFVSDNGGPFSAFQTNVSTTSAVFTGQVGHSYGFYTIARDLVGNIEAPKSSAEAFTTVVVGDTVPPVTTVSVTGPTGPNGWYRGPVTVALAATDQGGTVAATHYSLDGGATVTGTAPFSIATDGIHQVVFWSIDSAGNQEAPNSLTIMIDSTPPAITATPSVKTLWPANGKMVPVIISGSISDGASGLASDSVRFSVTDEYAAVQPAGVVSTTPDGRYSVTVLLEASRKGTDQDGRTYSVIVTAVDRAGNQVSRSVSIVVPHDQGRQ